MYNLHTYYNLNVFKKKLIYQYYTLYYCLYIFRTLKIHFLREKILFIFNESSVQRIFLRSLNRGSTVMKLYNVFH